MHQIRKELYMKKAFALSMVIGIAVIIVIVLAYESSLDGIAKYADIDSKVELSASQKESLNYLLDVIGEDEARDVIAEFAGYGKLGVTDIENLVEISNMVKSEAEAYNFTPEQTRKLLLVTMNLERGANNSRMEYSDTIPDYAPGHEADEME